ncbi:MAG TPA: hypothetical protein VFU19_13460 [Iamia sp.]|nr:hypothetical protein [Iamia sp.]
MSRDAMASRISARQKVAAAVYRRNGTTVTAGQMARALELAVAWAQVAYTQGVTLEDLAGTPGDLSTIALDAVLNRDRRLAVRRAVTP